MNRKGTTLQGNLNMEMQPSYWTDASFILSNNKCKYGNMKCVKLRRACSRHCFSNGTSELNKERMVVM